MHNQLTVKIIFTLCITLISVRTYAQVAGATLTGTLGDQSGSVIPRVKVSVKNVGTNEVREVTTDSAGFYSVPNLQPGSYAITATAPGFTTEVRSGIVLTVGAQQVLNFTMAVGQVSQTVNVVGSAPPVELANPTIGGVVSETTVVELPLNGRDWTSLATLQPGVNSAASIQPSLEAGFNRGERGFGVQMTIDGARPQQNSYRLDGININDYAGGGPGSVVGGTLGVDAIQEFSVLTSNYLAEYGRTSGGVVNAVSRSGTNQFHGNAYEFLRNSALDARNYFDSAAIPEFRRNQFGGSLGGPIKKDRTFFFADYEGLRQNLGVTQVDTVPSLDLRNGIIHNADGTTTPITISPLVSPFLPLWPLPNGGLLAPGNTGIFTFPSSQAISENFATARLDHKFSDKDSLFGSWQYDKGDLTLPDPLDTVLDGSNSSRDFVSIEETHIFSPQLVNSFRVGYSRNQALVNQGVKALNPLAEEPSLATIPGLTAASISVPGLTQFDGGTNAATFGEFAYNSFQGYDDLFVTRGIHSLKFGFGIERDNENYIQSYVPGGLFGFGSLSQFLTNQPAGFFLAQLPGTISHKGLAQSIVAGYAQDDIHLRRNLTVNLGLRYETSTSPTERRNELSSLRNQLDTAPHIGGPLFLNPTLRNFAPRVGFAWDPFGSGKTSIRGGFGMFDVLPLAYEYQLMEAAGPPSGTIDDTVTQLAPGSFPYGALGDLSATGLLRTPFIQFEPKRNYTMQWNLNVQRELMPNLSMTIAYVGTHSVHNPFHEDDSNTVLPTLTAAGYLWPFPAASGTVLNPAIGRMDSLWWTGNAHYNGLAVNLLKRMSHGFQVEGSYTWSKSIDDSSASPISDPFANSITSLLFFDEHLRRAVSDFNVGQNLTVNYIWTIPAPSSFHGPALWAVRGWQLGGILQVSSGLPFTPLIGGDPLGENSADPFAYPDRLTGQGCHSQVNPGNVNNYIKLQCFTLPMAIPSIATECTPFQPGGPGNPVAVGTCSNLLGTSTRNDLNGPGLVNFDFSLFKNNQIKENLNVQFRAELFNVFNHSNFLAPTDNQTLFDQTGAPIASAGLIDTTSTTNREIQFALKLIW